MANETETEEAPAPKRGRKGAIAGLVLALVLGAGGFYAAYSGLIAFPSGAEAEKAQTAEPPPDPLPDIAFVDLKPLVVSLGPGSANRHLRFHAQLEVPGAHEAEVESLLPRILDVLNGYLRAVDTALLSDPAALVRLRAQMLRRVQVVTGEGRVRDLLITEFVLN